MTRLAKTDGKWTYKCDVCSRIELWQKGWRAWTSIAMDENIPDQVPTICSDSCAEVFEAKRKAGLIEVPNVKLRAPNTVKVSGKRVGY